ncbi:translocation/assembly module TamB domain-containing protein [Phenylobacterium sp.]|uniref:translocation/assembly module TamB domain-containing protein n=1 Tax=Phenylobacterium sp. TaxID=1871053 RepID=UPI0025EBDABD|nr:translocation/assembly module TamB domain-containing protein [Phenylobacterium sp.]
MSGPSDIEEVVHEVEEAVVKVARSRGLPKAIVAVCVIIAIVLSGLLLATRYGVLLPQGRHLIEARANDLKLGRFGRLNIEGLSGDVWRHFALRRLTISDEKGVWLEARNLNVSWHYAELLQRRLHAESITAQQVTILRRPTLTPKQKSRGLPVSFDIDLIKARLELQPAFSYRRGVYDVTGNLDVQRRGRGQRGRISAASVLHAGDHLNLQFDLGKNLPLLLVADAHEARGGALAGALGLPADQPFDLKARADGKMSSGKLAAVATFGGAKPLEMRGAWTPEGGQASGRLDLTASTLTRKLSGRLGPEALFVITGARAEPGLYALSARVQSANLTVLAKGKGNLGERRTGPKGLALTLDTANLSKISGGPQMGPARAVGILTGTADDARFVGTAAVDRLKLGSYGLDRISGPVQLTRKAGVLSVKGQASGAGGQGTGVLAAILGAKPSASFDAQRLADGRLSLRDLEATGAGLKVQASGGRGLIGGLNFKGRAEVSNLAAARTGAKGSASATWSATQGGPGKPWTLSADAKGAGFASGFAELDRLLGASPSLSAKGNIQDGKISLASAELNGAAVKATSAGVLENGALKFKLDWSADGPFRAGPVEITGKARGSGAITGTLAEPRADLLADFDALDVPRLPLEAAHMTLTCMRRPDGSSGLVTLAATSEYGPAVGKAAFRFPQGGVDLSDVAIDAGGLKASGALALRRSTPSSADLKIMLSKGAFLEAGQVTGAVKIIDASGGPRASLNLRAVNAVLPGSRVAISTGQLTADGPLDRLPYAADAKGASSNAAWAFNGKGVISQTRPGYAIAFDGMGRYGSRDLRTLETAVFKIAGRERSARLRLAASDGGEIELDGRLAGDTAQVRAQLRQLGLGLFNEDLTGKIDADLNLAGKGARLDGTLDAKLEDARAKGSDASQGLDGTLKARLADSSLAIDADFTNTGGLKATANLVLPAEASAAPFRVAINRQKPIRGRVFADGEVKPLWDLLVGGERELAGHVRLDGTLGGTLSDIRTRGEASVDDGRFSDGATGLTLRSVILRATLTDNVINVTRATGADGHGGSATGSGRISQDGVSTFKLDLTGFRLIDNDQATASASGQVTLDRDVAGKVRVAGKLLVERADVSARTPTPSGVVPMEVVEVNKPVDLRAAQQAVARQGLGVNLDITLTAPRRIYLRGRGLDVELSLDAHVGGTTNRPVLSGVARVVRGDYDFAGKRFEFDERGVVYLATSPRDIRLSLSATRDDPSLTAVVSIRGTAAKPEITLSSTPTLPNDEVLSNVLFGRSASQLSPLEAAQLASALSSLAGGGGFDVIGNLRTFAGLDRLAVGGGGESGMTISGGKYLTDDVYLELTGGGREGPSAQVEWRVRKNLSIISKLAGQGDGKLAVRWRKDY